MNCKRRKKLASIINSMLKAAMKLRIQQATWFMCILSFKNFSVSIKLVENFRKSLSAPKQRVFSRFIRAHVWHSKNEFCFILYWNMLFRRSHHLHIMIFSNTYDSRLKFLFRVLTFLDVRLVKIVFETFTLLRCTSGALNLRVFAYVRPNWSLHYLVDISWLWTFFDGQRTFLLHSKLDPKLV